MSTTTIAAGATMHIIEPGDTTPDLAALRLRAQRMLSVALREPSQLDNSFLVVAVSEAGDLIGAQAADLITGQAAFELHTRLTTLGAFPATGLAAELADTLNAGKPVLRIHQLAVHPDWRGGLIRPALRGACWQYGITAGADLAFAECWLNGGDQSLPGALRAGWHEFARIRGYWSTAATLLSTSRDPPRPAFQVAPEARRCTICGPAARCCCGAALIVTTIPGTARDKAATTGHDDTVTLPGEEATSRRFARVATVGGALALVAASVAACDAGADHPKILTCVDSTNHVIDGSYCGITPKTHPAKVPAQWNGHDALPSGQNSVGASPSATSSTTTSGPTSSASPSESPSPIAHGVYVPYNTWLASQKAAGSRQGAHEVYAIADEPLGRKLTTKDVVNPKTGDTVDEDGGKLTSKGIADDSGKGFGGTEGYDSSNGGHVAGGGGEEGGHGGFGGGEGGAGE